MKANQTEDDDNSHIARDGEVLVVKMTQMADSAAAPVRNAAHQIATADGAMHRPGYAAISDADITTRQTTYDAYQKRLASAYKDPPPLAEVNAIVTAKASAGNDAYAVYDASLSERWRSA